MYGDSIRDYIVGFLILDPARLKKWADAGGRNIDAALLEDPELRKLVHEDILKYAVDAKLNSLEKPKQFKLLLDPFHNEPTPAYPEPILTPTSKLKRNIAKKHFKDQIDQMYTLPIIK